MKKVLITGACGFIGQTLCRFFLQQGITVIGFVMDEKVVQPLRELGDFRPYVVSFEQYAKIEEVVSDRDIDVTYHLAWDGTSGEKFRNYALQLQNARFACEMLVAAHRVCCKKFILIGTVNQLEIQKQLTLDSSELRYTCLYGTAKTAAEMMCKTLAYQLGIEFNHTLLANVYGPGDRSHMIQNVLISHFLCGKRPKLVEGNYLYDWIYIDDVVRLLAAVGEKGVSQRRYYIGHTELETFRNIALKVRDILCPGMECVFGEYPDNNLIDYGLIDINALYHDTGVKADKDFTQSILETAEWVRQTKFEL